MIVALSIVPVPYMDVYIDALSEYAREEVQPLMIRVGGNYIWRPLRRGNGRRSPFIRTEMWNMYSRTKSGEDRTNNHAEAAHKKDLYRTRNEPSYYMEIHR